MEPAPVDTPPERGPRALRTAAFRVAISLCRSRIASTASGRFAWVVAVAVAAGAFAIALSLRVTDGPAAPVGGLLRKAAIVIAWVSGSFLATAAAKDATAIDRLDGVEALVAARGVGTSLLRAARTLGATAQMTRTLGVPVAVFALGTAFFAGDVRMALRRIAAAALLLAWGLVAGVTLSTLAGLSARMFGARGPSALFAIVIGERIVAGWAGLPAWSVPGALEAVLAMALRVSGVGGGH